LWSGAHWLRLFALGKVVFPDLKSSTETISLRMPTPLLHAIKREANRRDVPYQSLIKVVLAEQFTAARA
jgi:predicted DNA binding CopG/RHH family protein